MQLKYLQTITETQNGEYPICALAWAPNNKKLAIGTCERSVLLFDTTGTRRDKFSTKPSDPNAGKKSYSITSLGFNIDSELLAVGQSDNIVFVYRVGSGWETKKVICNKFFLSSSCTSLYWITETTFLCGLLDGKIRSLECKTNKSSNAWMGNTACISLSGFGNIIVSGHADGSLLTFGGRLLAKHQVSPSALCILENAILVGGCDKKIVVYDNNGRHQSNFDYTKNVEQKEFTVACASPSGQIAVIGSYNQCQIIEWSTNHGRWTTGPPIKIKGLLTVRAIGWSADGSRVAISGFTGATLVFEAMMKRWMCSNTVEAIRRGQGQITLRSVLENSKSMTVQSVIGRNIHSVKIMGGEKYAICRTENSLIICDLERSLSSEISWMGTGERFFFQHAPVCLIYLAGELTLVEYGMNNILAAVRTEFINPHQISVRINEGNLNQTDNKKMAYLLDPKNVCVIDLITGLQITQARLEARADWLELSESAHILLMRDRRRRLLLLDIATGKIDVILSNVNFVQWVENSDAVVAQTPTHLAVWYSVDDINSVELLECGGGTAVQVEQIDEIPRIILENGSLNYITLDNAKLKFCAALRVKDFDGCEAYLKSLSDAHQVNYLWQFLAEKAMEVRNLHLAVNCYKSLGDEAKASFLSHTLALAEKYEKQSNNSGNGLNSPHVRARLSILSYDLKTAEDIFINELQEPEKAIDMYIILHRWPDAFAVADKLGLERAKSLRDKYMSHLLSSGAEKEAANLLVTYGDVRGALKLMLQADLPGCAARLLRDTPALLADHNCYDSVLQALIKNEWWEQAAELCENIGNVKQAIEYYAKADCYAKAVQKARQATPEKVISLEHKWGEYLMEKKQWGAAVAHLIEAGDSKSALEAAIKAQQWTKALQIIQVIDDVEAIQKFYVILADHFSSVEDWKTAEALWEASGLIEQGAQTLGNAGQWIRSLAFVRRTLGSDLAMNIFQPEAERLNNEGNYKDAEDLYVGLGLVDTAITMYETATQHSSLLRLVKKHRPQLLGAARRRVAQSLRDEERYRQAEQYYLEADDWKSAIQMYRAINQWEEAYRIAQQHAPSQIQEQVVVAWSNSIEDDATAARILINHGALEAGIRWAARGARWSRALNLCHIGAPHLEAPVRAQMAAQLEDEGKLEEAEAEFVKGGGVNEAIDMWLHAQQYARALSLAEQYAPEKEAEVLQAYADWAEAEGDLPLYEALIIRSGRPQDIIKYYKNNFMWDDAIRVCEEYLPQAVRSLRDEALRNSGVETKKELSKLRDMDPETLLRSAVEYTNKGEYWDAVQALLSIKMENAGAGTVERATLRAARIVRDHFSSNQAREIAPFISQKLSEVGQEAMGIRIHNALISNSNPETETLTEENSRAEQLARRGEWQLALEAAATLGMKASGHMAVKWAADLLQKPDTINYQNSDGTYNGGAAAALAVLTRWGLGGSEAGSIAAPLLARISAFTSLEFNMFKDLRNVLHLIMLNGANEDNVPEEIERMVEASSLLCVREACGTVPALRPLTVRASTAVLRHTDLIAADNAFYEAGNIMKEFGREGEALVFLNRYLDLAEAAEVDLSETSPLDHTDFANTDFPHEVILGGSALTTEQHNEVREWVLAISLDENISQILPLDKRNLYECCLAPEETGCVLTGFPLTTRTVRFTNGRLANRDAWAKLQLHCNTDPGSNAADCRRFINSWCGADDYNIT